MTALYLVGIGGHGGAGKSTLARRFSGAQVVGTDEFWNGSEFELSRLEREVIRPLRAGREARFHGFDWGGASRSRRSESCGPAGVVVVEGVCALHRDFRDAYDLRIWVEAPREVRLARGVARDGEDARETWENVWMPREEAYVAGDDPCRRRTSWWTAANSTITRRGNRAIEEGVLPKFTIPYESLDPLTIGAADDESKVYRDSSSSRSPTANLLAAIYPDEPDFLPDATAAAAAALESPVAGPRVLGASSPAASRSRS